MDHLMSPQTFEEWVLLFCLFVGLVGIILLIALLGAYDPNR